ncbi:MAG: ribonuclease HII [Lentilactobacillus diolivorans]|jgi:ribonuclease HII|nr:ribonuclease HII [Lentilactobacillus diolivorans]RRG04645.1 MAG: ribonuclease HII [Lactobacillus sp.]
MKLTISDIKKILKETRSLNDPLFAKFSHDSRKGVQMAIQSAKTRIQAQQRRLAAFEHRFKYERELWHKGIHYIAGVDEVGRGPLAGPVVAAAAILPKDFDLIDVNDSKQLTPEKRLSLAPIIRKEALCVSIGLVSNEKIDQFNIYQATRMAMKQAIESLSPSPEEIIVDAMQINVPIDQIRLIKGDAKSISVSAASVVAKVYRDQLMDDYAKIYPQYDFHHNAGYGTAKHLAALKKYGPTPIHRRSFSPVQKFLQ